jgi:hypothetical protein
MRFSALQAGRSASDTTERGGMNLRYDASSGDVQAHERQSCFAQVLQGG